MYGTVPLIRSDALFLQRPAFSFLRTGALLSAHTSTLIVVGFWSEVSLLKSLRIARRPPFQNSFISRKTRPGTLHSRCNTPCSFSGPHSVFLPLLEISSTASCLALSPLWCSFRAVVSVHRRDLFALSEHAGRSRLKEPFKGVHFAV